MNSPIKLPPLPDLPEQDLVDVIYSPDGDEGAIFEWDERKLKAWATAYGEQAVREALAAQVPVAFISKDSLDRLYKPHVAGCAAAIERRPRNGFVPIVIIPENNHAEGADQEPT